ncbi:MAG TPA: single-stranded-DNA-specific exonuclease RecJ, partial [Rhodanobacteraceae bacterium]|nr:single-stranded-DNA-specific exonuclease RecJ [Rhodanobacteraceae bacterium]
MRAFTIKRRACDFDAQAWPTLHPVLARIYASRGIRVGDPLEPKLAHLADPAALGGIDRACELLTDAIANDRHVCIVGDFDADGATGTAVAVRALRILGARRVSYRVPNRFRH